MKRHASSSSSFAVSHSNPRLLSGSCDEYNNNYYYYCCYYHYFYYYYDYYYYYCYYYYYYYSDAAIWLKRLQQCLQQCL